MINEIKSKNSYTGWVNGDLNFIDHNQGIGDVVNPDNIGESTNFKYQKIPCVAGNKYTLSLFGGNQSRAYGFIDSNNVLRGVSESLASLVGVEVTAPCDGMLLVNNRFSTYTTPSVTGVCRCDRIQHKDGEVRKVYCNEVLGGWVKDKYINTSGDVGSVVDIEHPSASSSKYGYQLINCQIGNKFTLTCNGGTAPRAWCFVDKDDKIVSSSNSSVTCRDTEVVAPCDGKLIVHNKMDDQPNPSVKKLSKIWYPHGLVDIGANQSFSFTNNGSFLYTNGNIGGVVDFTSRSDARWGYYIVNVKKGDTFTLTCTGGSNARAWCFTDNQRMIMSQAEAYAACTELSLTAPRDGYLIVQNNFENIVSPSLVRTNAHTYPTVKIGTREWLGANLDETLGKIQTDEFYYNNDKFTYGKYGKLYKWDTLCSASETHSTALAGILPTGWRLAKKADFEDLVALDSTCNIFRDEGYGNGSNLTNFSAVTGGIRKEAEGFMLPNDSFLWSSTGNQTTTAWRLYVKYNQAYSTIGGGDYRSTAFNVRLVRDLPADQVSMVSLASPSNDEPSDT